ncbi:hypothetical protein BMT54_09340 [Pasteurellaceae bacterium 15-036681]|nr:hypothetical protein BMT54_09340 [Pasteurellaceae bacterium 15-036681]
MSLDFFTLRSFRQNHPSWRLLCSDNAPLIISFLYKAFIEPNERVIDEAILSEMLEDHLYQLREQLGEKAFPKSAKDYLNDWASAENGWLRKFYKMGSDEAQFDLMPATEKAIGWLTQLAERQFVGTESRLLTLFNLLKEIRQGSELDPEKRIAELEKQRAQIDQEIAQIKSGDLGLLDDTAVKERFLQFSQGAKELLADFREVEHNFRQLDSKVRKQIALWEGSKGELLAEIMGERDAITDSDQGKSFRAFWDFLLSQQRQQEFSELLDHLLTLPALKSFRTELNQQHIHYDWLEAGEHTQRTVAQLSQQLRHFLDDKAWLENRRIMEIFRQIESKVFELADEEIKGDVMTISEAKVNLDLPMERPLYSPTLKLKLDNIALEMGDEQFDSDEALFNQRLIDKGRLIQNIRFALQQQEQITLQNLIQNRPLEYGLAELVSYLQLDQQPYFKLVIDDELQEEISWGEGESQRSALLPRIIFSR